MSLWKKISSFVHGAAVKVSDAFVKIFGKDAAHQFAQGTLALLKTAEGKIVLDAVEAAETLSTDGFTVTSAGKRVAAFDRIVADFKTQGYQVGENVINMLIELAVSYLKGTIAAA